MDQAQYDQLKDSWADVEDRDGVRLAWNVIPSSKVEANRLVVPIRYGKPNHPGLPLTC